MMEAPTKYQTDYLVAYGTQYKNKPKKYLLEIKAIKFSYLSPNNWNQ